MKTICLCTYISIFMIRENEDVEPDEDHEEGPPKKVARVVVETIEAVSIFFYFSLYLFKLYI